MVGKTPKSTVLPGAGLSISNAIVISADRLLVERGRPRHTAPRHVSQPCVVSQFFVEVAPGMSSSDQRRRHTGQQGDAAEHEAAAAHEAETETAGCDV